MARLVALRAGGQRTAWQSLSLPFDSSSCQLADVTLEVTAAPSGLHGWTIESNREAEFLLDGIPTQLVESAPHHDPVSRISGQKIVGLDHVVVTTDDIVRTSAAIERELGLEVRRERTLGNGVTQRFHKLDNTIIEVVSGPHVSHTGASLWGMVISVDDLFDLCDELGEAVTSTPKKATQPGRYISTVRGSVGLGVPFAMMTPHVSANQES